MRSCHINRKRTCAPFGRQPKSHLNRVGILKYFIKMKTEQSLEGFSEISLSEQQEINGGIWTLVGRLLVSLAAAAATAIINDWDNFKNGLQGLPEEK